MNKKNIIDIKKVIVLLVSTVVLLVLTVIINNIDKYDDKTIYNNKNEYTTTNNKVDVANNEIKNEVLETEVVQHDNISHDDINIETIEYFESVEQEIDTAILNEEESFSSKAKEKFVLLVDFIFYGTEINGVTFEQLTDDTKKKLIEIVNRVDIKIEEKVPGYKETISSGAKESYTYLVEKLKQGIDYLDDKAEEKIGTEKYNEIKENVTDAKEEIKEGSTKLIDKGKQIINNAKEKVKNGYEGWKEHPFFVAIFCRILYKGIVGYLWTVIQVIEFVVCDDDKKFLEKVINVINKMMLKKNFEYRISKFYDFDISFLKNLENKENPRIYVLDIELPSRSGINIGKIIRKTDLESPIIFLTGHEELGNLLLRKDINFFAFINKFEDFEIRLKKNILSALNSLNKRKFLEIKDKKIYYRFSLDNILYITRESVERKAIIRTDKNTHSVNSSLSKIADSLDDRFIQTHRSCFINKDRAVEINYRKKVIVFDNGEVIDLLSSNYKKGEIENVI